MSKNKTKHTAGFSLTEMLIATGIMAIGLMMVATVFPVGVKLASLSAERSVGSVVADEAFAKVQLYGLRDFVGWPQTLVNAPGYPPAQAVNATYDSQSDFLYTLKGVVADGTDGFWGTDDDEFFWPGLATPDMIFLSEFRYPSADISTGEKYRYHWSALCRRVGLKDVQVTVFVTRKALGAVTYYNYPFEYNIATPANSVYSPEAKANWPTPIRINVMHNIANPNQLTIRTGLGDNSDIEAFAPSGSELLFLSKLFDEGYTILGDHNGRIARILEMQDIDTADGAGIKETIVLYEDWQWSGNAQETIWVVPPGVGSSRYPCVGVYQKIIRFDDIN